MQRILRAAIFVGEEVGSVKHRIAEVLERRPVKLIGSALGDDIHLAAGATAELRCSHAGLNSEFLHRIGDSEIAKRGVNLRVDVANAVEQEDVGLRTGAGDVETTALSAGRGGQDAGR